MGVGRGSMSENGITFTVTDLKTTSVCADAHPGDQRPVFKGEVLGLKPERC